MNDNLRVTIARFMGSHYASLDKMDYASRLACLHAISLHREHRGLGAPSSVFSRKGEMEFVTSVRMDE